MAEYPKYPDKFHWRKKFLIPKSYLYKLKVLEGLTAKEIAAWHRKELGVKISVRTVKYYLAKFSILTPQEFIKKKKYRRPPFNRVESLYYLQKCYRRRQSPFRYLDNLHSRKRRDLIGVLFAWAAKREKSRRQKLWFKYILMRYEVAPSSADLLFPKRYVIFDWRKVNELRAERGVSVYEFCKIIGIPRRKYTAAFKKGSIMMSRRYALIMMGHFNFPPSKISKEIENDRRIF